MSPQTTTSERARERKRKERGRNSRRRKGIEERDWRTEKKEKKRRGDLARLDEESGVRPRLPRLYRFDVSNLLAISEPDNFYEGPGPSYVPPGGSRPFIFPRATLREAELRRVSRRSTNEHATCSGIFH